MSFRVVVLFASALLVLIAPAKAEARDLVVFAAASLKNALEQVAQPFTARTGIVVRFSFAASSALARQIEQGAPADLFASADTEWMDYLATRKLVRPDSRVDLLSNRLVLVAQRDSPKSKLPLTVEAFTEALGPSGRVAVGEVTAVPAGRYARAALEHLGLWAKLQPRLAQAENVRAALLLVSRGEAPLGIVYQTDAAADSNVNIVAIFPAETHAPIIYPFAVTDAAKGQDASAFLDFVQGGEARRIFEAHGFTVLRHSVSN
jgi:molybdate transport system substrate-binding protein